MSLGKRLFNVIRANLGDLDLGDLDLGDLDPRRLQDFIPGSSRSQAFDDEPLDFGQEHEHELYDRDPSISAQHRRWYKDLRLEPGASVDEIRQAYRRQIREFHPDRFASDPAKLEIANHVARGLTEAYNGLLKLHG